MICSRGRVKAGGGKVWGRVKAGGGCSPPGFFGWSETAPVGPPRHRATPTARGCGGVPAGVRVHVTSRLRLFPRRFCGVT